MEAAHYEQAELWGAEHVFNPAHQLPRFQAVHELLPSPAPESLVDVGAGDGRLLRYLTDEAVAGRKVATDRSRAALAKVDTTAEVVQASIDQLPFPDRSFPVAVCCEVLEHLPSEVFDRARAELSRIARDFVIVTVPNRENRARSAITCELCGCRYNPDRHLRSFAADQLTSLVADFELDRVIETGPRQPVYPRQARLLLERTGVLQRPGSPTCPQCGAAYRFAARGAGGNVAASDAMTVSSNGARNGRRGYDILRKIVPKARHPYYLCARFRRVR